MGKAPRSKKHGEFDGKERDVYVAIGALSYNQKKTSNDSMAVLDA